MVRRNLVNRALVAGKSAEALREEAMREIRGVFERVRKAGNFNPITTDRVARAFEMRGFSPGRAAELAAEFEKKHFDLLLASGRYVRVRDERARKDLRVNAAELAKRPALRELDKLRVNLHYARDDVRRASNLLEMWKRVLLVEEDEFARLKKHRESPQVLGLRSKAEVRGKIGGKQGEINAIKSSLLVLGKEHKKARAKLDEMLARQQELREEVRK